MSLTDYEAQRNEVRILETLNHPNIVVLLDFFEDLDHFYLVFEYCS